MRIVHVHPDQLDEAKKILPYDVVRGDKKMVMDEACFAGFAPNFVFNDELYKNGIQNYVTWENA